MKDEDMRRRLLVATRNVGKVVEFEEMLSMLDVNWLSLDDVGVTVEVEETGKTFLENAVLKAQSYAKMTGLLTLADDSGLEVDALGGAPGVFTARYGGAGLTAEQRYQYLLSQLSGVPWENRSARFRCVIAIAGKQGELLASAAGACEGVIAEGPSGSGGFGYDPVFFLPERGRTMAELPAATKHAISHRGRALQAIKPALLDIVA
jgi:XTP/dITP diphosphohydrolase